MDIFKLFFDHDLRLDKLAPRNDNSSEEFDQDRLADFMKPDPTYSKFYITGTRLEDETFGINTLHKTAGIIRQLDQAFSAQKAFTSAGTFDSLSEALAAVEIGEAIILSDKSNFSIDFSSLKIDDESNIGHKKEEVREVLQSGALLLYKEKAHHGFDLHLFSKENIYPVLFESFKPLVDDQFRFFSINSKRMGSERHFYFETWTLDKPPHGAEEVFAETAL